MKSRQSGMTLMELLVVVAIIGILAAIAIPSYRQYVMRANRTDAKTALMNTAQNMERCFTNSTPYAYDSATCLAAVTFPVTAEGGTYIITAPTRTATQYTLVATPQAGQANDTQCRNFQLTESGQQTVTGTLSATPQQCWRR